MKATLPELMKYMSKDGMQTRKLTIRNNAFFIEGYSGQRFQGTIRLKDIEDVKRFIAMLPKNTACKGIVEPGYNKIGELYDKAKHDKETKLSFEWEPLNKNNDE